LANAMFLFLVASGLSLSFGVSRIINFAQGSFYMLAAYLTSTLLQVLPPWPGRFLHALLVAPAAVADLGGLIEIVLLRRVYRARGALPPDPLGRAPPRGHRRPRDGGRPRRRPALALHHSLRVRDLARGARGRTRRAPRGPDAGHGHDDHRGRVRRRRRRGDGE